MPRIFVRQFIARDKQVYNIHKVVNMLGQVVYEAEPTKPYIGIKRATTEQELTNMLDRPVESAYTAKPNKLAISSEVKTNKVTSEAKINVR